MQYARKLDTTGLRTIEQDVVADRKYERGHKESIRLLFVSVQRPNWSIDVSTAITASVTIQSLIGGVTKTESCSEVSARLLIPDILGPAWARLELSMHNNKQHATDNPQRSSVRRRLL